MKFFKQAQKYGSKALVVAAAATLGASSAMAQDADNPIVTMLNGIGLTGITAAVIAAGLVIVGIAMAMKGPVVAKRVINKI